MLKKVLFFALAITLVTVGFASAASNVANTSQKGSLLIFPKIYIDLAAEGANFTDTWVTIGNDYFEDVWVKCYWVNSNQDIADFMFRLTPNQPIAFSAAYGTGLGDSGITVPAFTPYPYTSTKGFGELKCWAVNAAGDQQISWNHLYGTAVIVQENGAVAYNAWSFAAKLALKANGGKAGEILLNGTDRYDACPTYLVTNFVPAGITQTQNPWGREVDPDLTLVACKQDLRQDRTPTVVKAKFDVWNENETKYTGAYQCVTCLWEGFLDKITYNSANFTIKSLKTPIARFRVQSADPAKCGNNNKTFSPFLGLMLYAATDGQGDLLPFAGHTPFTAGLDGTGFVLWDTAGTTPEAPQQ